MKNIWFLIVSVFYSGTFANYDRPDITLLSYYTNETKHNFLCVVGKEENGQGVSLIYPGNKDYNSAVSKYKGVNGNEYPKSTIDTDFENSLNGFKGNITHSGTKDFEAITDERWEKFDIYYVLPKSTKEFDLLEEQNSISFSIRSGKDVSIFLCESVKCYWLAFNYEEGQSNTLVRLVKYTDIGNQLLDVRSDVVNTGQNVTFNINIWKHFTITGLKNNAFLNIFESGKVEPLIQLGKNQNDLININRIIFTSFQMRSFWKIHKYQYLQLEFSQPPQNAQFSPEFSPDSNGQLCLALYATVCKKCSLRLTLNDVTVTVSSKDSISKELVSWQYIRISTTGNSNSLYRLTINLVGYHKSVFWAIDDVRQCHQDEVRILEARDRNVTDKKVFCQTLTDVNYSSIFQANKTENTASICDDVSYVGKNCDIPCLAVTGEKYCEKHTICKTGDRKDAICVCSSGYWQGTCKDSCTLGYYSYNCKKQCLPCKGHCKRKTGECTTENECANNDLDEGCKIPDLPILLYFPELVNSTVHSLTVSFNTSKYMGKKQPSKYQIEFKNSITEQWEKFEELSAYPSLKEPSSIIATLDTLEPNNFYDVRLKLYTMDNKSNNYNYIPQIRMETKCAKITSYDNFKTSVKVNASDITANFTWSPICEEPMKFKIETTAHPWVETPIISFVTSSLQNGYTFDHLIPLTQYWYQISITEPDVTATGTFWTQVGKFPRLQIAPEIINTTLTSIGLSFHKNDIRGQFEAFVFEVQYKNENESVWIRQPSKTLVSDGQNFAEISNCTMETKYIVRVIFYTNNSRFDNNNIPFSSATTTCSEDLKRTQPVVNLEINPQYDGVHLMWKPLCGGNLKISVQCVDDNSWCSSAYEESVGNHKKSIQIRGLSPYANYSIDVENDHKNKALSKRFSTLAAAPLAVGNFSIYTMQSNSIGIRWKVPFPPRGQMELYQLSHQVCSSNPKNFININEGMTPCSIWPDFMCYTIEKTNNECYKITIRAKNLNVPEAGEETTLVVYRTNIKTEPPVNITVNWEEPQSVCWQHPNCVYGTLNGFHLEIVQMSTLSNNRNFKEVKETYQLSENNLNYCYPVNKMGENNFQMPLSSTYQIKIRSVSNDNDESQFLDKVIKSPPVTPRLTSDLEIEAKMGDKMILIVPKVDESTYTEHLSLYIFVCAPTEPRVEISENLLHNQLEKLTNCAGLSWIAIRTKYQMMNEQLRFIVGDNDNTDNIPLKNHIKYIISVIILNEYEGKEARNIYSISTEEKASGELTWNPAYLSLLLLLLLPVIAYFIYRNYGTSKNKDFQTNLESASSQAPGRPNTIIHLSQFEPKEKLPKKTSVSPKNSSTVPLLTQSNEQLEDISEYSRPILVNDLCDYVKQSLENGFLDQQHQMFRKGGTQPWEYGMKKENKFKNRYNNLTAYDHTRVILSKIEGDPFSDFINANYIDGYGQKNAYIATQGPKPNTINDFWRMVWEDNVEYIVMLANLIEGGKRKCEQYWPDIGTTKEYRNISVSFLSTDLYADFEYRTLEVRIQNETRIVQHYHFTSWPDHGVPLYPQSLVPFLQKIREIPIQNAPVVVHCSAGVGRTGTIILSDICLRMAAEEDQINPLKYLNIIRQQRVNLVDNFDQYKLVHMVILECILSPDTNIPCDEYLSQSINDLISQGLIQKQMNFLQESAWRSAAMVSKTDIGGENVSKNRFPDIIPDRSRVFISRYPFEDENSDYINAVPVDGFRLKDQFIVTQNPLPHTVKDFWRMICEQNVDVIVVLNEFEVSDETSSIFWPLQDEEQTPMQHLNIVCRSTTEGAHCNWYQLNIYNKNAPEGEEKSSVNIFQFKNWSYNDLVPQNPDVFISFLEEAQNLSRLGNPLVVTCYDGARASGLFVALSFVIEKIKLEENCDVCLAVRFIRSNRGQFVKDEKQFQFLYKAAITYLQQFDGYSNFVPPSN